MTFHGYPVAPTYLAPRPGGGDLGAGWGLNKINTYSELEGYKH